MPPVLFIEEKAGGSCAVSELGGVDPGGITSRSHKVC